MWVSRKDFDALKSKVEELERRHQSHTVDVMENRNFMVYSKDKTETVYNPFGPGWQIPVGERIALKTVVERILNHLGMELQYVEGKPTSVIVAKKAKASKP